MLRELRHAFRSLLRTPGFSSAALLILALGIGATSGVFALVKAVLLEALPYTAPDRLLLIRGEMRREGAQQYPLSYLDIEALNSQRTILSEAVPVTGARPFNLAVAGAVENATGELAGAGYLRVLGLQTALGRMFTAEEARAPGARVVVLSYDLWQRRFGARNDVLGSTMHLNELPYTIIGVAAPGFTGVSDGAQFFLPIGLAHALYGPHYIELRPFRWLSAVARLKPDVSLTQAQSGMDALATQLARNFPADNDRFTYTPATLPDAFFGALRRPLFSLLGAAALVLLIACANVANLLLARAAARRREFAVRAAIGASRSRLLRQVLTESILLVAVAATIGLLLASAAARFIVASGAIALASFTHVRVDPLVVLATVGSALLCALLFGLVPAFSATRVAPLEGLRDGGKGATMGRGRRAFQHALVVSQVALALTLLSGAGLMSKGFRNFLGTDLGFRADSLLTLRADLTAERYANNEQVWQLLRQLRAEGRALPGVRSIELEGPGFPTGGWYLIHLRTSETAPTSDAVAARRHHVSSGYFSALGITRLAGRDFDDSDAGSTPRVAVVSRAFAQRAWPGQNPIGKLLYSIGATPLSITVVGMVDDVEHSGLQTGGTAQADIYLSIFQSPPRSPAAVTVIARTGAPASTTLPALQTLLERLDPNLAFHDVQTMAARLRAQTSTARFLVRLITGFAGLGLLLAAVGIYAVIAYTVAQRTREIGIRMALGARRAQVIRAVVRQGLNAVIIGTLAGLAAVFYLQRFITALLYGVSPLDPAVLGGTAALLATVGVAASWLPALRAARAEPSLVLRKE